MNLVSEHCRSNIFDWLWLLSSCWAIVCRMLGWPIKIINAKVGWLGIMYTLWMKDEIIETIVNRMFLHVFHSV